MIVVEICAGAFGADSLERSFAVSERTSIEFSVVEVAEIEVGLVDEWAVVCVIIEVGCWQTTKV